MRDSFSFADNTLKRKSLCRWAISVLLFFSVFLGLFGLAPVPAQAATNVDTFAELNAACQKSGTVTITSGISLTDTITIPKGVTVYLTCTHDAGSTAGDVGRAKGFHGHMFKVNDGATLYIRCCINGSSKDSNGDLRGTGATGTESDGYYGQAMILNYGHVIMDNDKSVLKNNYNVYNNDYKSGALWTYSGTKYYGLSSGGDGETDLSGSAILCVNGKFTMSNGQIYGCVADNGPAIYACNGYSGDVITISGGKIHDNLARRYGGAIFAASRKPYSAYENSSSFVGSRTLNSTGSNALVTVSGGNIYNNVAKLNSGAVWVGFGGTFYMSGGSIYNNKAIEEGGGGIRVNAGGAGTTGGWMCFANPGGQAWIAGGSIYNNTCATNGGGITVPDNDDSNNLLKITGGNIYGNTAGGNGAGIYLGSKLSMSGGSVYKNKANGDASKGGGIYLTGTATGTISGGKVYSNTAVDNGGGVSAYGSLTVSGGYIYGNSPYGISFLKTGKITGGRFGVSAYTSYSEYTVSRNTKAQVHVGSDATLSIAGGSSRMVSALSGDEGVGTNACIVNNGTTTVETSCNADNGYLDMYGTGSGFINNGKLYIKGKMNIMTSAKDGSGVQNRRGIYNGPDATLNVSGDLSIRNCSMRGVYNAGTFDMSAGSIYGCEVDGNGAGVYNTGIFRMSGGSIHDNTTEGTGGAVYCGGDDSRFNMSGGSLYNNTSGGMGGAVYYTTGGLTSRISGGSIYNNTAGTHGGAVASYRTNNFYISGGDIYSNTATSGGGAVFNGGTLLIEEGAKIRSNKAGTYGGGIYNSGASAVVTMSGGSIYSNTSTDNGGGIYNGGTEDGGGKLTMSAGNIYSNTAGTHAGGVYFTTNGDASTISGGSIYSNSAANGGGMSTYRTNGVTLSNVKVYNNKATGVGGGIRSGAKLVIDSGFYYGNNAVGVYAASGALTINGGRFGASAYSSWSDYTVARNVTSQITVAEDATCTINTTSYPRIISQIDDGAAITSNYGLLNYGKTTISNASTNSIDFYGTGTSIRNQGTLNINGYTQIVSSGKDGSTTVQDRLGIYNSAGTVNVNTTSFTVAYCGYRGINNAGTFNMKGGNIHHCACPATNGGGVYNTGTFNMTAGSIYTNTATNGDGIFNVSGGTLKMSGTALVKSDDTVFLGGTTHITTGDFTGDNSIRAYLKGDGFEPGRVVAKYATPASGAGTDALYWNPDAPSTSEQYFVVSGKLLRAGDQGAANNAASGISAEDVFISDTYTLSFNGNLSGVTVTVPNSVSKYWGETKSVTFADAKANVTYYTFKGWNTKADGSGNSYTSPLNYATNMDLTLYAQWDPISYTVKYNGNGNTGGSTASSSHVYGTAKNLTSNGFTKTGYTFNGWNTKDDGSGTAYTDKQSVKNLATTDGATVNLYAQWKVNTATIRYHANGGSINSDTYSLNSSLVYNGTNLATTPWSYGKTPLDLYNISTFGLYKTGYHIDANSAWLFNGTNGSAVTYNSTTDSTILGYFNSVVQNATGGTITMYANWKPNTYTVNYDGNGSTGGSTASGTHTYDAAKNLTANGFTKTGYTFNGWNTKADGSGTAYADKATVKNLTSTSGGTVTLYAQWTPISYTVQYNGNGATGGSTANSTHIYDTSKALTANGFTKPGFGFVGWNTKADGTGTAYTDNQSIKNLSSVNGATVTLYAQWVENSITVVYHSNNATLLTYQEEKIDENYLVDNLKDTFTYSDNYSSGLLDVNDASNLYLAKSGHEFTKYWLVGSGTSSVKISQDAGFTGKSLAEAMGQSIENSSVTVHVYADWKPNSGVIYFYPNGGTAKEEHPLLTEGEYAGASSTTQTFDYTDTAKDIYNVSTLFEKTGYHVPSSAKAWKLGSAESSTFINQASQNMSSFVVDSKGVVLKLFANWQPNTYTIVYDGNGADDGSTDNSTHTYDSEKKLTANGYSLTDYVFAGWNTEPDGSGTSYTDQQSVKNLTTVNGKVITLYAIWVDELDEGPIINAVDRWFTLEEAQAGKITLNELMSSAEAEDSRIGRYTDFEAGKGTFTIVDYDADEFLSFEGSGSTTVTYYAEDLGGNIARARVTIHIIDTDNIEDLYGDNLVSAKVRFISDGYFLDVNGDALDEAEGGLNMYSKWVTDSGYSSLLDSVLNNKKTNGVWDNPPVYSFTLTSGRIEVIQDYLGTNGAGRNLRDFFNNFLKNLE